MLSCRRDESRVTEGCIGSMVVLILCLLLSVWSPDWVLQYVVVVFV